MLLTELCVPAPEAPVLLRSICFYAARSLKRKRGAAFSWPGLQVAAVFATWILRQATAMRSPAVGHSCEAGDQVSSLCNVQPTPDLRVYVEPSTRSCSSSPASMFCREPLRSGSFRDNSVSWVSAEMRGWRENMEEHRASRKRRTMLNHWKTQRTRMWQPTSAKMRSKADSRLICPSCL